MASAGPKLIAVKLLELYKSFMITGAIFGIVPIYVAYKGFKC